MWGIHILFWRCLLLNSTLIFGLSAHSVNAEDFDKGGAPAKCAVSQSNGKVELAFGKAENDSMTSDQYHGAIALSTPLDCLYGLQIDGLVAQSHGDTTLAAGVHLFARDPQRYLLGFYGDISSSDVSDSARLGVEGELYFDKLTLSGAGGWENNEVFSDDKYFGIGQLSFYPNNNLKLSAGIAHTSGESFATFGSEWQPQSSPVSLFAQGATNGDDFHSINGGIRIHFGGEQKSLIRRHREDDPDIFLSGPLKKGTEIATFKKVQREEKRLREIAAAKKDKQSCKEGYAFRVSSSDTIDSACVPSQYVDFTDEQIEQANGLICETGYSPYAYNDVVACHPSQPIGLRENNTDNFNAYYASNPIGSANMCTSTTLLCKSGYSVQEFMGMCRCLPNQIVDSEQISVFHPDYYSQYLASLYVYGNDG